MDEDMLQRSIQDEDEMPTIYLSKDPSIPALHSQVEHPKHYTFGHYEVFPILQDWFPTDPLAWQVGKCLARYKHKGNPLGDLKKAEFYLKELIKNVAKESQ